MNYKYNNYAECYEIISLNKVDISFSHILFKESKLYFN